jgi:glutathione S-transferase
MAAHYLERSMLVLHGFASSNYYNVVKLALLEKELPFEEKLVYSGAGESYRPDYLGHSPIGKVPSLQVPEGSISESRVIIDYLERAYPERPLYPSTPFEIGKLNELTQSIDLYLELAARRVIPNYFARKPAPENIARDVRATLAKGVRSLTQLARFDREFVLGGDRFTAADVAAVMHLPAVRAIAQGVFSEDPFANVPGLNEYLARMEARPTVQRVRADQKADGPAFFAHLQKQIASRA